MAELGVTQEQFIEACDKASENPLHKKIVDQIIAVDNFMAFKKLMVKRNTELNEQAIKMFQHQHGKQHQPPSDTTAQPVKSTEKTKGAPNQALDSL